MWPSLWVLLVILIELGLRLVMVGVILVRARVRPSSRIAWIVTVIAIPIIGTVLYLLIGEVRLGRGRMDRYRRCTKQVIETGWKKLGHETAAPAHIDAAYEQIATLAQTVNETKPTGGNALRLLHETDLFIQALVEDIDAASDHCHLLFYIMLTDHSSRRVAEALMRAAERGVTCRLMVDSVGSKHFLRSDLRRELASSGVHVAEALPANVIRMLFSRVDVRNHRKIAVIDGRVGYTGSHNLADAEFALKPRFAPWVDTTLRIEGPVVRDLQAIFLIDWYLDTDEFHPELLDIEAAHHDDDVAAQVIATGPTSFNEALYQVVIGASHTAREELIITTPYFVPDEMTLRGLCATARRGVEVTIILPARNDSPLVAAASAAMFAPLLEAGVRIRLFNKGLLHAKTLTVDRDFAIVSSANMDRRSFELNFEISVIVYDTDFASQLRFLQHEYMTHSTPVTLREWKERPWPRRAWQNAVGILSPLL